MIAQTLLLVLAWQDPPPTTIRAETRAVEVNVIVEDHRANLIQDLRKEDFKLFDNGKPRDIQIFAIDSHEAEKPAVSAPFARPANAASRTLPGATAVVLDRINTKFRYQKFMLDEAIKSVAWMPLDENIGVLQVVPGLKFLPFTRNRVAQITAMKTFHRTFEEYTMEERVAITEVAMIRLAAQMRKFPGRKSIIWIGEGIPFDPDFEPAYAHIIDTLNGQNIALYTVDANALGPDAEGTLNGAKNTMLMQMFADRTGGLAFYNRSDLKQLMDAAFEDTRFSYVLGFYLKDDERDNKEHRLKVQVSHGRAVVRYRRAYSPAATTQ